MTKPIEVFTGFYFENGRTAFCARMKQPDQTKWTEFSNVIPENGSYKMAAGSRSFMNLLADHVTDNGNEVIIYTDNEHVLNRVLGDNAIAHNRLDVPKIGLPEFFYLNNKIRAVMMPNYGGSMKYCQNQAELLMAKHNNTKKKSHKLLVTSG